LDLSSVLSVVFFGLFQAYRGKYAVSEEVEEHNVLIWEQIVFIGNSFFPSLVMLANNVIFFLSGIIAFEEIFHVVTEDI